MRWLVGHRVSRSAFYLRPVAGRAVTLPGGVLRGARHCTLSSRKRKLFGAAAQINWVLAPGLLLTLVMRNSNSGPSPESTLLASSAKHDTRKVLIVPVPSTLAARAQLPFAVSPARATGGLWKVTTLSSKVKSPWNATSLSPASIFEVVTAATKSPKDGSTFGNATLSTVTGIETSSAWWAILELRLEKSDHH